MTHYTHVCQYSDRSLGIIVNYRNLTENRRSLKYLIANGCFCTVLACKDTVNSTSYSQYRRVAVSYSENLVSFSYFADYMVVLEGVFLHFNTVPFTYGILLLMIVHAPYYVNEKTSLNVKFKFGFQFLFQWWEWQFSIFLFPLTLSYLNTFHTWNHITVHSNKVTQARSVKIILYCIVFLLWSLRKESLFKITTKFRCNELDVAQNQLSHKRLIN